MAQTNPPYPFVKINEEEFILILSVSWRAARRRDRLLPRAGSLPLLAEVTRHPHNRRINALDEIESLFFFLCSIPSLHQTLAAPVSSIAGDGSLPEPSRAHQPHHRPRQGQPTQGIKPPCPKSSSSTSSPPTAGAMNSGNTGPH
jgi:hypothetical protein